MAKEKAKEIKYKLSKITTLQFAIIDDSYKDNDDVSISLALGSRSNKEKMIFSTSTKVQFEQQNQVFMLLELSCDFSIKPEDWKSLIQEDGSIILPKNFVAHLSALTVSTARGVIHAKTENTKYNRYFLPTINVAALIKEDVKI